MKTRYIEDDDLDIESTRELSLSPSTLLGIFFLLAIVCAIFFGFGYSMGKRSGVATSAENGSAPLHATGGAKPSPTQSDDLTPADAAAAEAAGQPDPSENPVSEPAAVQSAPPARLERAVATPAPQLKPAIAVKPPVAQPVSAPASRPVAGAPALVQIAAVSHQEDADILVSALKRRGYTVAVHHEPQDKLLHVQIGPFPTRKDADTMRQRLTADGYNAIVK